MTKNRSTENQESISYYYEDEISLIDLWLVLIKQKRRIAVILVACIVIGLIVALLLPKQYNFSTAIEIGSRVMKDSVKPIESPQTLLAKIQESYVPLVQLQYSKQYLNDNRVYQISARVPKESLLIVLESKGLEEDGDTYKQLQQLVVDEVKKDHQRILEIIRKELEISRNVAINELEELKDNHKLLLAREKRLDEVTLLLKQQIEGAKKDLEHAENNRQRSIKEAINAEKAMTLLILDADVHKQRERIANLEERLIIEIAAGQDELSKSISDNARAQQNQQDKISRIKVQLLNLVETRSLVPPMQSAKPIGLSKKVILMLAIVSGLFLAIFIAFFVEFLEKVKQRQQQNQQSITSAITTSNK
ncbi:MAG: hypothetical protein GXP08_10245 [Gammaproteobacteria bacterium]|nr:hypothetical protein [Gammaproteobacteria bacterium]